MFRPDPEPSTLEYQLLLARRRMQALAPGSPSWDAAIEGVEELERALASRLRTLGATAGSSDNVLRRQVASSYERRSTTE